MSIELSDTSVWARQRDPQIRSWFSTALASQELAMCDMVALEVLRGVHPADYLVMAANLRAAFSWIQMESDDWRRVLQIQALLAATGTQIHHSVKITDLLIAAAAERANVTLVHYDQHFDVIGAVTGQPMRWVATRGTLG